MTSGAVSDAFGLKCCFEPLRSSVGCPCLVACCAGHSNTTLLGSCLPRRECQAPESSTITSTWAGANRNLLSPCVSPVWLRRTCRVTARTCAGHVGAGSLAVGAKPSDFRAFRVVLVLVHSGHNMLWRHAVGVRHPGLARIFKVVALGFTCAQYRNMVEL
jgi:hypothetical protein